MKIYLRKALWCVTLVSLLAAVGCGSSGRQTAKNKSAADNNAVNDTIGMYAEIFASAGHRQAQTNLLRVKEFIAACRILCD